MWTARKHKHTSDEIALHEAWREVLEDPHYIERRRYEERVNEARAHAPTLIAHELPGLTADGEQK